MPPSSNTFQEYAWFSVQVDQYYAAIRIFARHYDSLKLAYSYLPKKKDWPSDFSCLSEPAKTFFVRASSALNYMGTTQVFTDAPFSQLNELPKDIVNFGFYTCFCFQWTLFESFVKQSIMDLAGADLLPTQVVSGLKARESGTKAFLQYIDKGHVFGHTPFTTVLPIMGYTPKFEKCDFRDLDLIREQRNQFIHALKNPSILPATEPEKERLYERSMWILRQFAGNIYQDIQNIRGQSSESANSA